MAAAVAVGTPAIVSRIARVAPESVTTAAVFGAGVVGASLVLAWAGEAAEEDLGQGLALAILAFIAVVPEYAVDLVLALRAGGNPERYAPLAAANTTGANRLLIGVGWALVAFIAISYMRRHRFPEAKALVLERDRAIEICFLAVASIYSLSIPVRYVLGAKQLNLFDSFVLVGIFGLYLFRLARGERVEHEFEGVGIASEIAALPARKRRRLIGAMMVFAGIVILASADPFAESLIQVGHRYGINEFLLIQWLAPLASEAPELIIACTFALRGRGQAGIGAVISSEVNQWTVLVGTLPIAYTISAFAHGRSGWALPLDGQQAAEFFLTGAQSLLAIAFIANLSIERWEAVLLFSLFALQFVFPQIQSRVAMAVVYLVLAAAVIVVVDRHRIGWRGRGARGAGGGS